MLAKPAKPMYTQSNPRLNKGVRVGERRSIKRFLVLRLYFHQSEEPSTQWYCSAEVKLRSTI
ncbi:hypothetical protein M378DRAFT_16662 [Amanita muscaria Koide BX008]|uniref:Uncharacterized protein n=1 Tax=Amanita muscaria (strain Koide BX008) TaxID=946122 RepID=A0A0C2WJR7_AMAMK|nr:hypothetical protein M378DRAFT_16662 [Amanita muscaria Koide BX008]